MKRQRSFSYAKQIKFRLLFTYKIDLLVKHNVYKVMVSLQKTSPLDSYGLLFKVEQTSNGEKNLSGLLHLAFEDEQKSYGVCHCSFNFIPELSFSG